MIDRDHDLPVTRQAKLLNISRGTVYYLPRPVADTDLAVMRRIDELHLEHPFTCLATILSRAHLLRPAQRMLVSDDCGRPMPCP